MARLRPNCCAMRTPVQLSCRKFFHALDQFRARRASRGASADAKIDPGVADSTRSRDNAGPTWRRLLAEPVLGGRLAQAQSAFQDRFC